MREVTSNMMIAHCPWMLRVAEAGAKPVSCVCVAATTLSVLWFEVARFVLVSVTKAAKLLLRAGEATTGVPTASKGGYPLQRLSAAEAIRCREHLPCSIPHVEDELSAVGVELERVDLHAKGGWQQARVAVRSVRGAGVKGASWPRAGWALWQAPKLVLWLCPAGRGETHRRTSSRTLQSSDA